MLKDAARKTKPKTRRLKRPKTKLKFNEKEEAILDAATIHLFTKHGMFLVATDLREINIKGMPVWIITVTLRLPPGFEGYVGDLLYDGEEFTFLTPLEIRKERSRQIANDPVGIRQWEEFQASTPKARSGQKTKLTRIG